LRFLDLKGRALFQVVIGGRRGLLAALDGVLERRDFEIGVDGGSSINNRNSSKPSKASAADSTKPSAAKAVPFVNSCKPLPRSTE